MRIKQVIIIIYLLIPTIAFAYPIGNVVSFTGQIWIKRNGKVFIPSIGTAILRNDTALTGTDGRMRILFVDNSVINIGSNSEINMAHYESTPSKRNVLLSMIKGKVRFFISKVTNIFNTYDIHTITAIIGIRGTNFIVDASHGMTGLYVIGGIVSFRNTRQPPSYAVEVTRGMMSFVRVGSLPSAPMKYTNAVIQQLINDTTVPFSDNYTSGYNSIMQYQPAAMNQPSKKSYGIPNALQQPQPENTAPVNVNIGANYGNVTR